MSSKSVMFAIFVFWGTVACFAHPTEALHYRDMACVFDGYGDQGFRSLCKDINSGIDSKLPQAFREAVGPVPGNHRILGHGWTLNAAIPKDTLKYLSAKYPGREQEIIGIWSVFARALVDETGIKTGLPKSEARALASILYDVHLLGDLEPDNKLVDLVLDQRNIVRNLEKDADDLLKSHPDQARLIRSRLDAVLDRVLPRQEMAQALMDELFRLRLGDMLHQTHPEMKTEYSIDRVLAANHRLSMRLSSRNP